MMILMDRGTFEEIHSLHTFNYTVFNCLILQLIVQMPPLP